MKTIISFDCEKDLNMQQVVKRAIAEYDLCKSNLKTGINPETGRDKQGRTVNDMKGDFIRGHCAEVYLLVYQNFIDDLREYQDVREKDTFHPVAVKVTKPSEWHIDYTKNGLKKIKLNPREAYRKIPDKLMIFTNSYNRDGPSDPLDTKYYFYAKYVWEDNDWKEVDWLDVINKNKPLQTHNTVI